MNDTKIFDKVAEQEAREEYPTGTRVECVKFKEIFSPVKPGTKGTVVKVTPWSVVVDWDNGKRRGAILGEDCIRKI